MEAKNWGLDSKDPTPGQNLFFTGNTYLDIVFDKNATDEAREQALLEGMERVAELKAVYLAERARWEASASSERNNRNGAFSNIESSVDAALDGDRHEQVQKFDYEKDEYNWGGSDDDDDDFIREIEKTLKIN
jgi:hypothetical protein